MAESDNMADTDEGNVATSTTTTPAAAVAGSDSGSSEDAAAASAATSTAQSEARHAGRSSCSAGRAILLVIGTLLL